jgi:molybdopterin/thiamine biosynthesis adenylyltransferase
MTAPLPPVPDPLPPTPQSVDAPSSDVPADAGHPLATTSVIAPMPSWADAWRAVFREGLEIAGFERAPEAPVERWIGQREIAWTDPATGAPRLSHPRVAVDLLPGFPFQKPIVRPLDDAPGSLHRSWEYGGSALCLWVDNQFGWRPWSTPTDVLGRADQWYRYAFEDSWPADQRAPDRHLIFTQAAKPRLMVTGEDWPPPSGPSGRFGVWAHTEQAMLAGGPSARIDAPHASAPPTRERLFFSTAPSGAPGDRGYWFRLPEAPPSIQTLAELFALIERLQRRADGVVMRELRAIESVRLRAEQAKLFVALGYTDPDHGEHWVFLVADRGKHARNWCSPSALAQTPIEAIAAAPATPEALLRRTGRSAAAVANKQVLIFGAGALGGSVAMWLAKAGVPHLRLVDSDILRPGNVVRHVARHFSLGETKSHATRWEILQHAPDCVIDPLRESWDVARIADRVSRADVVIDATAVPAFALLLNDVCVAARRPLIQGAVFHGGRVGRVRVMRPGEDACLLCYENGYLPHDETYPRIPEDPTPLFYESGCNVPTVDATAMDTDLTANVMARAAMRLLRHSQGAQNHAVIVVDPVPASAPPFDAEGTTWTVWPPRAACEACAGAQHEHAQREHARSEHVRSDTAPGDHVAGDAGSHVV